MPYNRSIKKLGGIDISQEYIDNANFRLVNITDKEFERFNYEMSLHKVNKTYKQRKEDKKLSAT
jgi:hypothetical protein